MLKFVCVWRKYWKREKRPKKQIDNRNITFFEMDIIIIIIIIIISFVWGKRLHFSTSKFLIWAFNGRP